MPSGRVVQPQKGGIRSDIVTAKQAFTMLLMEPPDDFSIWVGVGKLVQNLAVMAESTLPSRPSLGVEVPEMLWTRRAEKGVINGIRRLVG